MFRDCYFEYAGQYSGDYNLVMMYVEDSYEKFDSGGKYEVTTDTLPASAETLLYGLKHSEKPLEFSIEIINPDEAIPFEQLCKIKDWLFGQDGWKKLKLQSAEYQGYHLKCLLIPEEDIVDATGYRGVRCTLKNISAYWYGEDKTITYDKAKIIELTGENGENLYSSGALWLNLDIDSQSPAKILPIVKFQMTADNDESNTAGAYMDFYILNRTLEEDSSISISIPKSSKHQEYIFDCRYATLYKTSDDYVSYTPNTPLNDIFFFVKGSNRVAIQMRNLTETDDGTREFAPYEYISFTYTPMYRIGGF